MEYLKGGKRTCDSSVWQLYNKKDKLGGTRLTNRSDVGDPSLVSSRRNILVRGNGKKRCEKK